MDWINIINDLSGCGWTQVRIAERLGLSQSTIHKASSDPKFDFRWHDGDRLRKLHARMMRQKRKAVNR